MVTVRVEQNRGAVSRTIHVSAPSIEQALKIAGEGTPGIEVRVLFPIDPESFFTRQEAAEIPLAVV